MTSAPVHHLCWADPLINERHAMEKALFILTTIFMIWNVLGLLINAYIDSKVGGRLLEHALKCPIGRMIGYGLFINIWPVFVFMYLYYTDKHDKDINQPNVPVRRAGE